MAAVQASGDPMDLHEVSWPTPAGDRWFDVRVAPLRDADEVLGVHLVFMDVTDRVDLRTRLEKAHDELTTAYEELQSSSEELETTNEELQTLNDELRERTQEIDEVNGFLQGILEGLDTAVIVVDEEHRVQLWNTSAERLTGLRAFEVESGRLTDLDLGVAHDDLALALREAVVAGRPAQPVKDRLGRPPRSAGRVGR